MIVSFIPFGWERIFCRCVSFLVMQIVMSSTYLYQKKNTAKLILGSSLRDGHENDCQYETIFLYITLFVMWIIIINDAHVEEFHRLSFITEFYFSFVSFQYVLRKSLFVIFGKILVTLNDIEQMFSDIFKTLIFHIILCYEGGSIST